MDATRRASTAVVLRASTPCRCRSCRRRLCRRSCRCTAGTVRRLCNARPRPCRLRFLALKPTRAEGGICNFTAAVLSVGSALNSRPRAASGRLFIVGFWVRAGGDARGTSQCYLRGRAASAHKAPRRRKGDIWPHAALRRRGVENQNFPVAIQGPEGDIPPMAFVCLPFSVSAPGDLAVRASYVPGL